MALQSSSELVIGQWVLSPRLRALIDVLVDMLKDEAVPAIERLKLMRRIDTAEGVWLDYLGVRLGLHRPSTTDPSQDLRFGFSNEPTDGQKSGLGFDQAPFRGDAANDAVYPLPDIIYRRFLKARALLLLGDGTLQTFAKAVREIDPGASVQDQRTMTVRVVTARSDLLELADGIGALPRTAGVRIEYADRGRFGFSNQPTDTQKSGLGFDQAPFA